MDSIRCADRPAAIGMVREGSKPSEAINCRAKLLLFLGLFANGLGEGVLCLILLEFDQRKFPL